MTGPDYVVSPPALEGTASGIEAVLGGLRSLGPVGVAEQGRGVATLSAAPGDVAHAGLSTAFTAFCNRWEWGVRAAVRAGEDMAAGLRAAGASYGRADSVGEDLLARVLFDVVGDPGAPSEEATMADVDEAQQPDRRMPDWSRLGGQWADVGRDLVEGSAPGLIVRELGGADVLGDELGDLLPVWD
ncbi:MAG TPA: hypothetical protein VGE11_08150 [Pseudonocardia sp.]